MDQHLAYEYHHPTAHRMAVVRTLFFSGVTWAQNEEWVQQSLWKNGYPAAFISRHSLPQPVQQSEEQATRVTVTIPYIHGLSQSIRRVLSHSDIIFTFQPFLILNQDSVKSHSSRCLPACLDPLSPRVVAFPPWADPLNRGRGILPCFYATMLEWQRIGAMHIIIHVCLLVLASTNTCCML